MLIIQEPGTGELLKQLNKAAIGAVTGGGAFAFASKSGVEAFFSQLNILALLSKGKFSLIIGIDAITNVGALFELKKQEARFKGNLNIQIFKHTYSVGTIFHPKFSWFQSNGGGIVITGSGNLTQSGLGGAGKGIAGNWEAFTVSSLNQGEIEGISSQWSCWIKNATQAGYLFPVEDKGVQAKALDNNQYRPKKVKSSLAPPSIQKKIKGKEPAKFTTDIVSTDILDKVQVIEISKARWPQADVGKKLFHDFFGFNPKGLTNDILIQNVNNNGILDNPETRHLVIKGSKNYCFELGKGKGRNYPTVSDDRPIVVFVALGEQAFRYLLAMPDSSLYPNLLALLGEKEKDGPGRKMRKIQIGIEDIRDRCSSLPGNLFPAEVNFIEI